MPATYAHYRFGSQMLQTMPADIRRTAKRFRRMYDVGLHGPDLFFYYQPAMPSKIRVLGHKFHVQTGREFFSRVCRNLRMEPSEGSKAYLYGLLCHYTLDKCCHPLVENWSRDGSISHTRIETEFDRHLLECDGKGNPAKVDLSGHLTLTPEECRLVSRFYPGAESGHIRVSVKSMALIRKLLASQGKPAALIAQTFGLASREFADMRHFPLPDPRCEVFNRELMRQYQQAGEKFPKMLIQLGAHLTYNAPLGEEFNLIFG